MKKKLKYNRVLYFGSCNYSNTERYHTDKVYFL